MLRKLIYDSNESHSHFSLKGLSFALYWEYALFILKDVPIQHDSKNVEEMLLLIELTFNTF